MYNINRIFIKTSDYISAIYNKYVTTLTIIGNFRTLMAVNMRLSKANLCISDSEEAYMSKVPCREVVGALLWSTRPILHCQSSG